jgi:predicted transcriptional regulator
MDENAESSDLTSLTAEVVSAYVAKNAIRSLICPT